MAKDDFDLDDGMGPDKGLDSFDDGFSSDFDMPSMKDDRKAVTKFVSGARKELVGRDAFRNAAKETAWKALPKGYKSGIEGLSNAKSMAGDIYDKTMKEAQPTMRVLKKMGRRTIPTASKVLPRFIVDRINAATKEEEQRSNYNPEEMEISSNLASIFENQAITAARESSQNAAMEGVKLTIAKKAHGETMEMQSQIAMGISRLVGYQDNILSKFQRKSLELQHRQYFAAKELLEYTKVMGAEQSTLMQVIMKNTALPEAAKIQASEEFGRMAKQKLIGKVQENIVSKLQNLPGQIAESMQRELLMMVAEVNGLAEGLDQMLGDDNNDDDEMGMQFSFAEAGGSMLGSHLRNKTTDRSAKWLTAQLKKNKMISNGSSSVQYLMDNIKRKLNTKLRNAESGTGLGYISDLVSGGVRGHQNEIKHDLEGSALDPVPWDILARRSLIEVIPGYLSRMLQELSTIRAGEPQERIEYSVQREAFVTVKTKAEDIKNMFRANVTSSLKNTSDAMLKELDPKGKALSKKASNQLMMQMTKESADGLAFDPFKYQNEANIQVSDPAQRKKIANLFANYFAGLEFNPNEKKFISMNGIRAFMNTLDATDDRYEKLRKFTSSFNKLSEAMPNQQNLLNRLNIQGDKNIFEDMGGLGRNKSGQLGVNNAFFDNIVSDMLSGSDLSLSPDVRGFNKGGFVGGKRIQYKAKGGISSNSENTDMHPADTVPTMLTPGEYVIPRSIVASKGRPFFDKLLGKLGRKAGTGTVGETESTVLEKLIEQQTKDNNAYLERIAETLEYNVSIGSDGSVTQNGYFGKAGGDIRKVTKAGFKKIWTGLGSANNLRKDVWGKFGKFMFGNGPIDPNMVGPHQERSIGVVGHALKGAKWAGGRVSSAMGFGKNKAAEVSTSIRKAMGDLYMGVSNAPILRHALLTQGKYYYRKNNRKNGKKIPISTWDDLKNASGDIRYTENDEVVVLFAEIPQLFSKVSEKTSSFLSSLWGKVKKVSLAQFDLVTAGMTGIKNIAKSIHRAITAPVDVYVRDEIPHVPRLRKILFLNGGYISKTTGQPINHHDKIDGPVLSADGTTEVLSLEDIQRGLVDKDGNDIEGTGIIGTYLKKAKALGMKMYGAAAKIGKAGLDLGLSAAARLSGIIRPGSMGGGAGNFGDPTEVLWKIYYHIASAFPTDVQDGLADGPYSALGARPTGSKVKASLKSIRSLFSKKHKEVMDWYDEEGKPRGQRAIDDVKIWYDDKGKPIAESKIAKAKEVLTGVKETSESKLRRLKRKGKIGIGRFKRSDIFKNFKGFFKGKPKVPQAYTVSGSDFVWNGDGAALKKAYEDGLVSIQDLPGFMNQTLKGRMGLRIGGGIGRLSNMFGNMKKKIKGDTDGDGDRDGSWQDKAKSLKERLLAKKGGDDEGMLSKLFGKGKKGMERMAALFGKKKGEDENGGMLSALGKMLGLKSVGSLLGRALAGAATGSIAIAGGALSLLGTAIAGTATVAAAVMGTVASATMAVGGAILSTLSAPVVLGAIALAATGYAVWCAANAIERRRELAELEKLRFMAYGIPLDNIDAIVSIRYLEDDIYDRIKLRDKGGFVVDFKWEDVWKEYGEDFGNDLDNKEHEQKMYDWFYFRFIPVFVRYRRGALIIGKCKIFEIDDKINADDLPMFVNYVTFKAKDEQPGIKPIWQIFSTPCPKWFISNTSKEWKQYADSLVEKAKLRSAAVAKAKKDGKFVPFDKKDYGKAKPTAKIQEMKDKAAKDALAKNLSKGSTAKSGMKPNLNFLPPPKSGLGNYVETVSTQRRRGPTPAESAAFQQALFNAMITGDMSRDEMNMFIANMAAETGGFKQLEENLKYSPARLFEIFPNRNGIDSVESAARIVAGGEQAIAEAVYGGAWGAKALGNTEVGDGWKYRGRGFIHLTGRSNYEMASKALGIDLVNNPDLASEPDTAAAIAMWKWKQSGASAAAQRGDFNATRKAVNGGFNGLAEAKAVYQSNASQFPILTGEETAAKASVIPPMSKGPEGNMVTASAGNSNGSALSPTVKPSTVAAGSSLMPAVPTINVTPPDLSPLQKTYESTAKGAGGQRDTQISEQAKTNEYLAQIAAQLASNQAIIAQNEAAKSKGGVKSITPPVSPTKGSV